MAGAGTIRVEVAYALADRQEIIALDVAPGTTAYEAVVRSGIAGRFPGLIDPETIPMGIYSKVLASPGTQVLVEGDRVELYRPLTADPKDSRKERAQKTRLKREEGDAG